MRQTLEAKTVKQLQAALANPKRKGRPINRIMNRWAFEMEKMGFHGQALFPAWKDICHKAGLEIKS